MLRGRRCLGLKFRRQQQLGPFIVDFYCDETRLVIEVDGEVHSVPRQKDSDQNRDVYLREQRFLVLRFLNQEVFEDPESVLREVARATGRWWN